MPHDCLERFRMRSYVSRIHCRNHDADIGYLGGVAAVAANDAEDFRAYGFCVLQGSHQIGADILFEIAATHRKHEHKIVGAQAADSQPGLEHGCPTFVVHPGR